MARIAWARKLAASGDVDSAIAVLTVVRAPSLQAEAAQTRAQLLIDAASTAPSRPATPSWRCAGSTRPPRGRRPAHWWRPSRRCAPADEVSAAAELVASNRAPDAVALLDDAAAHGGAAAANMAYPSTLLAAGRAEIAALAYQDAAATLQRIVTTLRLELRGADRPRPAARARSVCRERSSTRPAMAPPGGCG